MPRSAPPPAGERIAKLLARAGVASRREVERMIAEGRIALGGVALTTPATVLASLDGVTVDGEPVAQAAPARLFLYHKPTGLLVTERDPRGRPTIYDRLPAGLPRVVPVGRLDLNTEGLLLLTTDGGLKRQLELPATGVPRTYRARVYGQVSQAALEGLSEGIEIEGIRYGSIDANLERRTGANAWIELTLTEGKNREVRRVLEFLGLEVGRLIRTRYGPFVLGDLPAGGVGEVRAGVLEAFRRSLAGGPTIAPVAVADQRPAGPKPAPTPTPAANDGSGRRASTPNVEPQPTGPRTSPKGGESRVPASPVRQARDAGAEPSRSVVQRPRAPKTGVRLPAANGGEAGAAAPPRPPKPQRKVGWAKPKPRSGPKKPR